MKPVKIVNSHNFTSKRKSKPHQCIGYQRERERDVSGIQCADVYLVSVLFLTVIPKSTQFLEGNPFCGVSMTVCCVYNTGTHYCDVCLDAHLHFQCWLRAAERVYINLMPIWENNEYLARRSTLISRIMSWIGAEARGGKCKEFYLGRHMLRVVDCSSVWCEKRLYPSPSSPLLGQWYDDHH